MKKIIKFLLIIVMTILTFTCVSCGEKSEAQNWDKFFKELDNAKSATIDTVMTTSGTKINATVCNDLANKISYTTGVLGQSPIYYVTNTEGQCFRWNKDIEDGKEVWESYETKMDLTDILYNTDYIDKDSLKKENFEFKKNKYYLKSELVKEAGISEMTVDFGTFKNKCVIKIVTDADTFRESTITITISKLNKTKINLPDEIKKETK